MWIENGIEVAYANTNQIDPKRAIPRDEQERTSKIFVGGVSQEASEGDFKEYFMQFGRVVDATLMMDKDTGRPRGSQPPSCSLLKKLFANAQRRVWVCHV